MADIRAKARNLTISQMEKDFLEKSLSTVVDIGTVISIHSLPQAAKKKKVLSEKSLNELFGEALTIITR